MIGRVEELAVLPAGIAGSDRPCLVGIGRLDDHALAEIVWPAITTSGLLRGLCVEVLGEEAGDRFVVKDVLRVTLGGVENNCLPGALILDTWEGEVSNQTTTAPRITHSIALRQRRPNDRMTSVIDPERIATS